jgi:prolyl oligopeptidase
MNQRSLWAMATVAMVGGALGVAMRAAAAGPPPTEKRPVEDPAAGVGGKPFVDDYRWLEGDNSNPERMGQVTPEVSAWTDAQNAYTRSVLDNLPGRKALEDRLRPLMEIGAVSAPSMHGTGAGARYFYTKREGKENQPKIMVRMGPDGGKGSAPRVLFDPAAVDASGLTALGGMAPSEDGKLLAYSTYRAGDENTTIRFKNVDTGADLPDALEGKAQMVRWMPDNSGVFYERLEDVKNPYSARVMYHKMGDPQSADKVLFRQYTKEENEKLATTWGPGAIVDRECRWMVLTYWTGTASNDIWAIDLRKWFKDGTFEKREIKVGAPNIFNGEIEGDTLYMLTDYGAPKKRLVAVDLNNPSEGAWKEVVGEDPKAVLTGFGLAKGGRDGKEAVLACDYEQDAQSRIMLYTAAGKKLGDLRLPGIGSAGVSTKEDRSEAYLSFTSFNYPSTIFRVDLSRPEAEPAVWERPDVPVDPSVAEVKQVFVRSKDGTKVPMFIVHKKGLRLSGHNPTIISGYGGFNISMTPAFQPTLFPWLEDGGVYALVNLRGGGEYGKPWHEAGMKEKKQNVFDDMIAASEWLVANGYTDKEHLGAIGGSNGGLLMGAMITQRPDLFKAIVCAVPLLDMARYQNFLMARYWVPEYGSAEEPDEWGYIRKWSPYHNVRKGVAYPAVLFTAGENDTRVHALHARKMAAAVQAATSSDPAVKPVMLWVDREAGHGQGKPLNLRIRDAADQRIFFMWQLGMLESAGAPAPAKAPGAGRPAVDGAASPAPQPAYKTE